MKKLMDIQEINVNIAGLNLLEDVSFSIFENDRLMIIGPNGAGKSTLLQAISQSIKYNGQVLINDKNLAELSSLDLAKQIGMFAQHNEVNYSFSVEEIVRLGRYAYSTGIFSRSDQKSESMVEEALIMAGIENKRHQSVLTLSGGELQRVFLAQLFAQDPKILLLDEPTNHVDIKYQKQLHNLLVEWSSQKGRAIIAVVHDLSLARLYGNKALLLNMGKLIACGEQNLVLTRENLSKVYQMDVYDWMNRLFHQWEA